MEDSAVAQKTMPSGPMKKRRADILHEAGIATEAMKASNAVHEACCGKDQDAVFTPEVVNQIEMSIASAAASDAAQASAAATFKFVEDDMEGYHSDAVSADSAQIAAAKAAVAAANKAAQKAANLFTKIAQIDVARCDAARAISSIADARKAINKSFLSSSAADVDMQSFAKAASHNYDAHEAMVLHICTIPDSRDADWDDPEREWRTIGPKAQVAAAEATEATKSAESAAAACGMRLQRTSLVFFKCLPMDDD